MPAVNQDDNDDVERQRNRQFQIYLAHYQVIRAEIVQHLAAQVQFVNYLVVVLGASVAGAGILLEAERSDLLAPLTIFLPIVVTPLACSYFYSFFVVLGLSGRGSGDLQNRLAAVASDPKLDLQNHASKQLKTLASIFIHVISVSRWLVWLVPVVGPTVYGWRHPYDKWGDTFRNVLWIDSVLSVLLFITVCVIFWETVLQPELTEWLRGRKQPPSPPSRSIAGESDPNTSTSASVPPQVESSTGSQ